MKIRAKHVLVGVLVFNIAMLLLTYILSEQAESRFPMLGSLVESGEVNIHAVNIIPDDFTVADESAFDAIVLIHGASTSLLDFANNLLPKLSERFRVVALDRPGHGYSERGTTGNMDVPAEQISVLFDTLASMGISKPILVGHSWAGSVVLAGLLADNDDVQPAAGILIAAVTHPYEREDSFPTRMSLAPVFGAVFRWQYLTPMGRMAMASSIERFFHPDDVPENYVEDTGLLLSLRPAPYLYNALDRSRLSDNLISQSSHYQTIDLPVLSIAASEDNVVNPADHHDRLMREIESGTAVVIDGAGHSPHHTRTNEVVLAIESFVEKVSF